MRKTIKFLAAASLATLGSAAHGALPLVDVDLRASLWNASPSGHLQSGDRLGLSGDLDYSSERLFDFSARVRHPLPVIPNVRIRYTDFEFDGTGTFAPSKSFEGQDYEGDVDSTLDLSHFDYTLFYTAPLPLVTLDLGFNVKHFSGDFQIADDTNSDSVNLNIVLPMVHAHGHFDLPLMGWGVGAEINYMSFDGDSVSDIEFYVSYRHTLFALEAGYRDFRIDADGSGDLEVDASFDGVFLRAGVSF